MNVKLILASVFICSILSCKKEDPAATKWVNETKHLTKRWKVQEAYKNHTGNEAFNGEDVTYDWNNWSVEFWNYGAYRIIDYSPDSTVSIIESGTWQLSIDNGVMLLRGSENLIEFISGTIIDEGPTERSWTRIKNENNEFWVWSENSIYGSIGVFFKMVPY